MYLEAFKIRLHYAIMLANQPIDGRKMDSNAIASEGLGYLAACKSHGMAVQRLRNGLRRVAHPLKPRPEDKPPATVLAAVQLNLAGEVVAVSPSNYADKTAVDAALRNHCNRIYNRRFMGRCAGFFCAHPRRLDCADAFAVHLSEPVVGAAARPAADGMRHLVALRLDGLGFYQIALAGCLFDLVALGDDPKSARLPGVCGA